MNQTVFPICLSGWLSEVDLQLSRWVRTSSHLHFGPALASTLWAAGALSEADTRTGHPGVGRAVEAAEPVHLDITLGHQGLWPDAVALVVPLLLDGVRMQDCQGRADARLSASTDGTAAAALHPVCHAGLPHMLMPTGAGCAQPPDFF